MPPRPHPARGPTSRVTCGHWKPSYFPFRDTGNSEKSEPTRHTLSPPARAAPRRVWGTPLGLCGSQSSFSLNFPPSRSRPPTGLSSCHQADFARSCFNNQLRLSYRLGQGPSSPDEPLGAHCLLHEPHQAALARPSAQ